MASLARPRVDVRAAAMPGGFPSQDYCEQPDRRPAMVATGMTTDTETTSSRSSDRPAPSRGILKSTPTGMTSQNPLAARFNRRPETSHHASTYQPAPFDQGDTWPYDSPDNYDSYEHETDSQSVLSEVSTSSTQATSVASDETVTDMNCPPSGHVKHIRHVPSPTVGRVKIRPRARTSSSTELAKSPPQKRQVHIQIFPPGSAASQGHQGRELQLSRKTERDLLDKIDELENQAVSLRDVRAHLDKELAEANEKLSVRTLEARDLQKSLGHERNAKEVLARELQNQRTQLDEHRSNLSLQKGMLNDAEDERETFRGARDSLEKQLSQLARDMTAQETRHKELEAILIRKASESEQLSKSFEDKFAAQNRQLKDLESQRKSLKQTVETQDKQLGQLKSITLERDTLRSDMEKQQTVHAETLKKLIVDRDSFKSKLEAQEKQMKELDELILQRDSLKVKIQILTSENAALNGDKGRLEERKNRLKDRVGEAEKKNDSLTRRIVELHSEIEGFKGEIAVCKTQIGEFEVSKKDLEARIEESESKAKTAIEEEKENTDKLIATEKTKLEEMQAQAATDRAELEAKITNLETELQGAKDANVVIVSERLEAKARLETATGSLATAYAEVKNVQDRNKDLESTIETTKAQITALEAKAEELNRLGQQHKELGQHAEGLQADLDKHAVGAAALQADKDKLASDRADLDALKETMQDATAMTKLMEEKASLESRVKDLEMEAQGLKAEETILKGEVEILRTEANKVPALTEQHHAVSAQLGAALQDLAHTRAALEAAAAQVKELNAQAAKLRSRPKERSGSRPRKHDRSRSTGLVFVRAPSNKGTGVFVTTREALKAEQVEK
ncbi:hypothetical protein PFICI_02026 [Pestalotiopsis fici W106-1]|uniref:Uncharacterized protein n=1 Tax=Pestalotiopsis fici (strain W106-1 / CGMCC3.15140) TaxID=1229662 RepID=W3XQ74_PESFW|nr:uncharacterized protein PFICI_02026 [Pestalotiopsis fici W106-1]ETS88198.1 hypothetical protein PFICI_02026 [Pestalotiopsis fici W106-1]